MLATGLLLLLAGASADADVSKAFEIEETCQEGSCGLELLQLKGEQKEHHQLALDWQGARETGSMCFTGSCGDIGPAECYHFRCVCRDGYVFSRRAGKRCISNSEAVSIGSMNPQDTGKTCYFEDCDQPLTACIAHKCRCIANYVMDWQQGRCRLPYEIWGHPQEASSTAPPTPEPTTTVTTITTVTTTAKPQSVALDADALCSAHPRCAGHNGFCCPTETGLRLECC